ncbi:MAG: hypothetical protein CM15mP74_19020 [Halieaceae bacterium]|nr:MAG: hypothetical protein CM15mP74_19020 [Halieaceae bacterium]
MPTSGIGSQQAKDIERFRWFSDDWLALDDANPNLIVDMRYSQLPNDIKGCGESGYLLTTGGSARQWDNSTLYWPG